MICSMTHFRKTVVVDATRKDKTSYADPAATGRGDAQPLHHLEARMGLLLRELRHWRGRAAEVRLEPKQPPEWACRLRLLL